MIAHVIAAAKAVVRKFGVSTTKLYSGTPGAFTCDVALGLDTSLTAGPAGTFACDVDLNPT